MTPNPRTVSSSMRLRAHGPARLALAVAVSPLYQRDEEVMELTVGGESVEVREIVEADRTRFHVADVGEGVVEVSYHAVVGEGQEDSVDEIDPWRFQRPSRYCESDTLAPIARAEFAGSTAAELLAHVSSWVGTRLAYVSGSSLPTDGAVRTLLNRQGVCRDYAHLVVALLRALEVPARVTSVYAPGLHPMDFHAVAEALVDGRWRVVDATTLAPRSTLVRIATGRDAADTAFLTSVGARVDLEELVVSATSATLPDDDIVKLVSLR